MGSQSARIKYRDFMSSPHKKTNKNRRLIFQTLAFIYQM
ncbi:Uncharacterised protein [Enterobacter hormaechei]|uniref:Uncharacterized protein n=1 Tax=Enterobacter hormaechei TaxID=158836 RepID=A0A822WY39_9ENTR|nr:Uncharacterised protein [Enterobacter hormaechei]